MNLVQDTLPGMPERPDGEACVKPAPMTLGERQRAKLNVGLHPLSGVGGRGFLRLHANAAPADDKTAPGLRCGPCPLAGMVDGFERKQCSVAPARSHAADLVNWWPACTDHPDTTTTETTS